MNLAILVFTCAGIVLAQEKNLTRRLTTNSGQMEIFSNSGMVKVEVIETKLQWSFLGPQINGRLLIVYDKSSRLTWWRYAEYSSDLSTANEVLTKSMKFHIDQDAITSLQPGGRGIYVRQSRLKASDAADAVEKVVAAMDEHIVDVRAKRVTYNREVGKKEVERELPYPTGKMSSEFFFQKFSVQRSPSKILDVSRSGRIWTIKIMGYEKTAVIEADEELTVLSVIEDPPALPSEILRRK